jgi:hypothetical protein
MEEQNDQELTMEKKEIITPQENEHTQSPVTEPSDKATEDITIESNTSKPKSLKKKIALWGSITIAVLLFAIFVVYPWIAYFNGNYAVFINMYRIKNFSIPEVETRRPVTLDASTLAETSV